MYNHTARLYFLLGVLISLLICAPFAYAASTGDCVEITEGGYSWDTGDYVELGNLRASGTGTNMPAVVEVDYSSSFGGVYVLVRTSTVWQAFGVGGECEIVEIPSTCSNDIWDADVGEEGVDCGGDCEDCSSICPEYYEDNGEGGCMPSQMLGMADEFGQCPDGFRSVRNYTDGNPDGWSCFIDTDDIDPVLASPSDLAAALVAANEVINVSLENAESSGGTYSTVTSETEESSDSTTNDAGDPVNTDTSKTTLTYSDGSSKTIEVITKTTQNADGTETVETTTTTLNIGSDGVVTSGSSSVGVSTYDSEGNLIDESTTDTAYEGEGEGEGDGEEFGDGASFGEIEEGEIDFSPLVGAASGISSKFPFSLLDTVSSLVGDLTTTPEAPSVSFSIDFVGTPVEFDFDFSVWNGGAEIGRILMSFIAFGGAVFLMARKWTS
jgi:hypothetical protein